jgi:hypothetical protein
MSKDNVCEWREISEEHDKTSCGHDMYYSEYINDFQVMEYCPYCGKPIRVIEEEKGE